MKQGSWYSSIFVHYYPSHDWDGDNNLESHYAVPGSWNEIPEDDPNDGLEELVVVGTSLKETSCENVWCGLQNSVKWQGPAEEGEVITTGWKRRENDAKGEL